MHPNEPCPAFWDARYDPSLPTLSPSMDEIRRRIFLNFPSYHRMCQIRSSLNSTTSPTKLPFYSLPLEKPRTSIHPESLSLWSRMVDWRNVPREYTNPFNLKDGMCITLFHKQLHMRIILPPVEIDMVEHQDYDGIHIKLSPSGGGYFWLKWSDSAHGILHFKFKTRSAFFVHQSPLHQPSTYYIRIEDVVDGIIQPCLDKEEKATDR